MSNMSYCRFRNTQTDLADCVETMECADTLDQLDLPTVEQFAMNRMYELCQRFIEQYETLVEDINDTK